MTEDYKRDMLEAIDKLIEHYEKYGMDEIPPLLEGGCPLCICSNKENDKVDGDPYSDCYNCPWILFENKNCSGAYRRQTTSQRLERLNRWKTKLLETKGELNEQAK